MALHPALLAAFDSWARVLTDWKVIGVFHSCPRVVCFADHPELAAPLVAEIGAAIREKQLRRRPVAVGIERETVTEPTYDRLGGPSYIELRHQMEAAQARYIRRVRLATTPANSDSPAALHAAMERIQSGFAPVRRRHEPLVEQARTASVRAFWAAHPTRGLGDDFFNDLPFDHSVSRLSRIEPAWWWRTCFARLQARLAKHHAADGCFLDALPSLLAHANEKTLDALVDEWCLRRADGWGWGGPGHYRMLVHRAGPKADAVTAWFNRTAPGYLADEGIRRLLHGRLAEHLDALDPIESPFVPGEN